MFQQEVRPLGWFSLWCWKGSVGSSRGLRSPSDLADSPASSAFPARLVLGFWRVRGWVLTPGCQESGGLWLTTEVLHSSASLACRLPVAPLLSVLEETVYLILMTSFYADIGFVILFFWISLYQTFLKWFMETLFPKLSHLDNCLFHLKVSLTAISPWLTFLLENLTCVTPDMVSRRKCCSGLMILHFSCVSCSFSPKIPREFFSLRLSFTWSWLHWIGLFSVAMSF